MKILRCHIENFGTLSDWDIEFQDGLTEICAAEWIWQNNTCGVY